MRKVILGTIVCVSVAFGANTGVCKQCHGTDLTKTGIMGTSSKNMMAMSKADFVAAINGYKAGTYGGSKKVLMKGQANTMGDPAAFADALGLK